MTTTMQRPRPRVVPPARPTAGPAPRSTPHARARRHLLWLAAAYPFAFAVPFLLADTLELDRDLFYGLYALAVAGFVGAWARHTGLGRRELVRNRRWGVVLGALGAAATAAIVLRTEDASDRPGALELAGALLWRGVVYGATDGVLLSVFPILAVFGAFAGTRLRRRPAGRVAIGALALLASIGVTVTYHLGYADFRSAKVGKTVVGDAVWSAPTLLTLSPLGAPVAHVGLHVTAVLHSYDTDLFLPPHVSEPPQTVTVYLLRGEHLAPVVRRADEASPAAAVRSLLAGPSADERASGLTSAVPERTRLRSLVVADGTATVDLSSEFATGGGSLSMAARLAQVTYTITREPSVEQVVYRVAGDLLTALGGEGLIVDGPQARAAYEHAPAGSLDASLLGPVLVEAPAHGAASERPLRVTGTAAEAFELVLVGGDGRILVERPVPAGGDGRAPFDVTVDAGAVARSLRVEVQDRVVAEIQLGGGAATVPR